MMDPNVVAAMARAVLARRIGELEIERAEIEARAQVAEFRVEELESELEEARKPARPSSRSRKT